MTLLYARSAHLGPLAVDTAVVIAELDQVLWEDQTELTISIPPKREIV